MRFTCFAFLIVSVLLAATGCRQTPAPSAPVAEPAYVPGTLIVELSPDMADVVLARRLAEQGLRLVRAIADEPRLRLVQVPEGDEVFWAGELVRQGLVVSAELNWITRLP